MHWVWVLLLVVPILAGCVQGDSDGEGAHPHGSQQPGGAGDPSAPGAASGHDGPTTVPTSGDPASPAPGLGAIRGLLVDQTFRPLHLTDGPDGQRTMRGHLVLEETGQQAYTDPNGEFLFQDVEPGQYTLRLPAMDGFAAFPMPVQVAPDAVLEVAMVVRVAWLAMEHEVTVQHVSTPVYTVGLAGANCILLDEGAGDVAQGVVQARWEATTPLSGSLEVVVAGETTARAAGGSPVTLEVGHIKADAAGEIAVFVRPVEPGAAVQQPVEVTLHLWVTRGGNTAPQTGADCP